MDMMDIKRMMATANMIMMSTPARLPTGLQNMQRCFPSMEEVPENITDGDKYISNRNLFNIAGQVCKS